MSFIAVLFLGVTPYMPLSADEAATEALPAEDAAASSALLDPDPLAFIANPISDFRGTLEEQHHLTFNLGYTLIWQFTDNASVVDKTASLVTGSYDFDGFWNPLHTDNGLGTGGLGWLVEGGHNITHNRSEDLSANVGSGLGINDDADPTTDIAITELWWQHIVGPVMYGEGEEETRLLVLTVGKIDQTVFFDGNRVANDETAQFLATPLVNSVAVAFPDNGIGFNATVHPAEWLYVSAGFGDANAVATRGGSSWESDELFYAGEVGFTPNIEGLGQGNYRVMFWTTEFDDGAGGTADGDGFSISIDQEVLPGVVPFLRYSKGDDDVLDFEEMFSIGVGFEGPLGRADDLFAVAFVQGEPSDSTLDDESIVEAFYRIKVSDTIEITPAVQAIFDPVGNPDESEVFVGAIRTQFSF